MLAFRFLMDNLAGVARHVGRRWMETVGFTPSPSKLKNESAKICKNFAPTVTRMVTVQEIKSAIVDREEGDQV